ncbi:MAG: 50S ribosomal protein L31 [Candidatus Parcubacteria bacterium]|nr:MAG: 50S ribosomal protein L31 [Candidatus Parcubacteria bacterium]
MKNKIHPPYFKTTVKCACGQTYEVYSTLKEINIEICKNCSPIFIGTEEKKVITGQVEKFRRKYKNPLSK